MGEPLGEFCSLLWRELFWLHLKWREFRTLYGASEKEFALMNTVAPDFFGNLQRILLEDIMLHIARLTDSSTSRGRQGIQKRNLSIRRLSILVDDPGLKAEVEHLVDLALEKSKFAKDWRNIALAHGDLDHAENLRLRPLTFPSRRAVEEALAAIREPVNVVEVHFNVSRTAFERTIPSLQGASALLSFMRKNVPIKDR